MDIKKPISIKQIRGYNSLTQKEMANMLGIPYSTYAQKESGYLKFTLEDLIKVKNAFGIPIDDIKEAQL